MRSPATVDIVIVEDHAATRDALAATIRESPEDIRIVNTYESAESLIAGLPSFDVGLIDLNLPTMQGAELISWVAKNRPSAKCIAVTVFDDSANVVAAVESGAFGYLLKDEPTERITQAILDAAAGNYPFSSRVAGVLAASVRGPREGVPLTKRETDLARLLANGLTYAEAAAEMKITVGTVQTHVKNLYRKLNINSRSEIRPWVKRHLQG